MRVEKSTKKTEPLDQSNMVIAIGKRNEKSNEITMLISTLSKLEKNLLAFFSQTANSEELTKQKKLNGNRNIK